MKKWLMALLMMVGISTYADIATFDIQAYLSGVKQKDNGSATLTVDSVFMLIADGNNDGLNMDLGWDQSLFVANNYLDNEIIYKGTAIDDGDGSYLWTFTTGDRGALSAGNDLVVAGDNYYMVWFEGLQNDLSGTPAANSWVGSYREATAEWQLPVVNGLVFPSADPVNMNNVTWTQAVPEPATALLVLIGGGLAYASRRAKRFHTYQS